MIALLDSSDIHHVWALETFRATVDADLVMPSLTYAEVLVHPIRERKLQLFERNAQGLGLLVKDVSGVDATALADLRANTNLKMPDVVALHEALYTGAALATTDSTLAQVARGHSLGVFCPAF